jgi:hypothetical protein
MNLTLYQQASLALDDGDEETALRLFIASAAEEKHKITELRIASIRFRRGQLSEILLSPDFLIEPGIRKLEIKRRALLGQGEELLPMVAKEPLSARLRSFVNAASNLGLIHFCLIPNDKKQTATIQSLILREDWRALESL